MNWGFLVGSVAGGLIAVGVMFVVELIRGWRS